MGGAVIQKQKTIHQNMNIWWARCMDQLVTMCYLHGIGHFLFQEQVFVHFS